MEVKEEHPQNAFLSIVVTLFGMKIDFNEEHPPNASHPIVVTLLGITMEVNEKQEENAQFPIDVIPSEIFTSLIDSLIEYQET